MQWFNDFHFLRPYWLIALLLPFLFILLAKKTDFVVSSWAKICDKHLLEYLLIPGKKNGKRFFYTWSVVLSSLLIIAVSGPTWIKNTTPALSIDNPVMIVLNLSNGMWAKDIKPSRIVRAEYLIKDLLKDMQSTETGLIVYSSEPYVITPLVEDKSIIENLLPEVKNGIMPEDGNRMDRAIDMAVNRMQNSGYEKGNIVILTADTGERFDTALSSAAHAASEGFDVSIIKMNSESSEKLQMIVEKGNGIYLNYNDKINNLTQKINAIYAKEIKQSQNLQTVWLDMGYYLLWLPVLMLLYYFRRNLVWCIFLLNLSNSAYAGWFLNDNQEAMRSFQAEEYAVAAQKFTDKQWKGAAAYKNGDFQTAYENFAGFDDAISLYNQGNALAKSGKIQEAIAKYEKALQIQDDFADARFNLEYLKKIQQQSASKQQNESNKQAQQDKQENKTGSEKQQSAEQNQNNRSQQQQDKQREEQNKENNAANNDKMKDSQANDTSQSDKNNKESTGNEKSADQNQASQAQSENKEQNNKQSEKQNELKDERKEGSDRDEDKNAMIGQKDENGKENASVLPVQNGPLTDEQKEKIRARLQKFREIPEDKGGLLRAMIYHEFKKGRYSE